MLLARRSVAETCRGIVGVSRTAEAAWVRSREPDRWTHTLPCNPVASRGVFRLGYRHTLAPLLTGPKTRLRPSRVSHPFDSHPTRALWACCIPLPIRGSSRFQPPCPGLTLGPRTVADSVAEANQTPGAFPAMLPPLEEHPSVTAGTHRCALFYPLEVAPQQTDDRNRLLQRTSSTRSCSITSGEPVALVARRAPDSILPGLFSPSRFLVTRCPIPPPESEGTDKMVRPSKLDVLILRANRCRLALDRLRRV